MPQYPYLQRKELYPKTDASQPIKYYPNTVRLASHCGRCAGCGNPSTRVDSYYLFELCNECDADSVGSAIAEHVLNPNG